MELKKILGDKYHEGMTLEEIEKALADISMVSEADYQKVKKASDANAKEASEWKKKYQGTLSQAELDKEKADTDMQAILDENKNLKRSMAISDAAANYVTLGYDAKSAKKAAEALVDGDTETLFKVQADFNEKQKKAMTAKILEETRRPEGGAEDPAKKMTREELVKMSIAEQAKFAKENPDEYKEIYGMKE